MTIISTSFGEEMTREKLAARMGDSEARAKVHRFNSDSINVLFQLIEEVVHTEKPGIPLGFMTGERYEEGYDFTRWAKTLAGPNNAPVWWRPGGGFYSQDPISGMTWKSHEIGRQIAQLPPEVINIQSEIENFTYDRLAKSKHITALEAASHIAAGCTGAAFNVLAMNSNESLEEFEPLVETISHWRPFYDRLVAAVQRKPTKGLCPLWKPTDASNSAGNPANHYVPAFAEIGIPIDYQPGGHSLCILTRGYLNAASAEEVTDILAGGVYMDNDTIGLLNSPTHFNVGNLVGVEFGGAIVVDGIEKYTDHPLNGKAVGATRDARQSFWRTAAIKLRKTEPNAQTLSSLVDYSGAETAETVLSVFENRLGGRVCVNGYYPWEKFFSGNKSAQLKQVMRWLSHDTLPGWIDSFHRAHLWCRQGDDNTVFVVLNSTFDSAGKLTIAVKTEADTAVFHDRNDKPVCVTGTTRGDGGYRYFTLPDIAPWDIAFVVIERHL